MSMDNLDTVIGFVVLILLLSLVVTTAVQLVVWLSNLRGQNLSWGLKKLFREFSGLPPPVAHLLAVHVLEHPALTLVGRKLTAIREDELLALLPDVVARLQTNPALPAELKATLARTLDAAALQRAAANIDRWFESIMDRTSEVFTLYTRAITTFVALVLAFAFHIDSVAIIKELATNHELRSRLVATAGATLDRADAVQAATQTQSAVAVRAVRFALTAFPPESVSMLPIPEHFASRDAGEQWLVARFSPPAAAVKSVDAYHHKFDEFAATEVDRLHAQATALLDQALVKHLGFLNFEQPPFSGYFHAWQHFWGTLITGLLLSLGAPFWHTVLRNLVALRPLVAAKADTESALPGRNPAVLPKSASS